MGIVVTHAGGGDAFAEGYLNAAERRREEEDREQRQDDMRAAVNSTFESSKTSLMQAATELDSKLASYDQSGVPESLRTKPRKAVQELELWSQQVKATLGSIQDKDAMGLVLAGLEPEFAARKTAIDMDRLRFALGNAFTGGLVDEETAAALMEQAEASGDPNGAYQTLVSLANEKDRLAHRQGQIDQLTGEAQSVLEATDQAMRAVKGAGGQIPSYQWDNLYDAQAAMRRAQLRASLDPDFDFGKAQEEALKILDRESPREQRLSKWAETQYADRSKQRAAITAMDLMPNEDGSPGPGQARYDQLTAEMQQLEETIGAGTGGFVPPQYEVAPVVTGPLYQPGSNTIMVPGPGQLPGAAPQQAPQQAGGLPLALDYSTRGGPRTVAVDGGSMELKGGGQQAPAPGQAAAPGQAPVEPAKEAKEAKKPKTPATQLREGGNALRGVEGVDPDATQGELMEQVGGKLVSSFASLGVQVTPEQLADPEQLSTAVLEQFDALELEDPNAVRKVAGQLLFLLKQAEKVQGRHKKDADKNRKIDTAQAELDQERQSARPSQAAGRATGQTPY